MKGNTSADKTSISKILSLTLAGLITFSLLAVGGPVGTAAAGNSDSDTLADKSVAIDNSTEQVYLEVTNTSGQQVNYTVYGVDDGITTQVDSGLISADSGNTTQKTWAADSETYDSYRFVVSEDPRDSDNETVQSVDVGEIVEQSSSGGGAIFGGSGGLLTPMNILIVVLLGAAAFLLGLFDPVKRRITG